VLEIITSDLFWWGIFVGYILGCICGFIVEILCLAAGRNDIDTWMESDDKREKQKNN